LNDMKGHTLGFLFLPFQSKSVDIIKSYNYKDIFLSFQLKMGEFCGDFCGAVVVRLWCGCGAVVVRLWCGCGAVWCGCGAVVVQLWCGCGAVVVRLWCGCGAVFFDIF